MVRDYEPCGLGGIVRETEAMKPTDEACFRQVSKSAGCNGNEPTCSLVKFSYGGRALSSWAKTASPSDKRGGGSDVRFYETRPRQFVEVLGRRRNR